MSVIDPTLAITAPGQADGLRCPLCDYDLRGLTQNRCPECGHAFDPAELRAARDAQSGWFFEHASARRLWLAFIVTSLGTLRPFAFWRRVNAAQRVVPRRLLLWPLLWALVGAAVCVAPYLVTAGLAYWTDVADYNAWAASMHARFPNAIIVHNTGNSFVLPAGQTIQTATWLYDSNVDPDFRRNWARTIACAHLYSCGWLIPALVLWPPAVVLALRAFGLTLRRAGIRQGHIWRCVLYAWPLVTLPGIALLVSSCFITLDVWRPYQWPDPWGRWMDAAVPRVVWQVADLFHIGPAATVALALAIALSSVHLVVAHVRYLRLPHAIAQALLVQLLAWLLVFAAVVVGSESLMRPS